MKQLLAVAVALLCISCGTARKSKMDLSEEVVRSQNEVINTGYGTTTSKASTYSIQKIKVEDRDASTYTTIYDYLKGRCPGVEIGPSGPGQTPSIRVRGINSINSPTEPLCVVDGTPVNDLSTIDPHDVYSVEVLKDACASMYGVRGANGVILVTTKSGYQRAQEEAAARKAERKAAKEAKKNK